MKNIAQKAGQRLGKNGFITTIIGLGIGGAALFFMNKDMNAGSSLQDAATAVSGWFMFAGTMLRSNDTIVGRKINKAEKDQFEREKIMN